MEQRPEPLPFLTRVVDVFLRGDVTLLFIVVSLIAGAAALWLTPREEEPQIVVPMADVLIEAPGLSAPEVERLVTTRLEKLLYQIDGVEYVYSQSEPGRAVVTVRFFVGEDREDSLVKLYNKMNSQVDQVPPVVGSWVVKPIEVDDVPIVIVTLWSERPDQYSDHPLRRIAEEIQQELQSISNTNRVWVTGGRPRRIRVELDAQRLAAHRTTARDVARALAVSNVHQRAGTFQQQDEEFLVDAGRFFRDAEELKGLVIRVAGLRPVHLKDVANVVDGPAEVESYSWIGFGPAAEDRPDDRAVTYPAVHLAVAKRKGSNAVSVADEVKARMQELAGNLLPAGIHFRITRDYGETANHKVNELVESLWIAVLTVIGLIGFVVGWRAALVVALAIPVCYSLTLFVNLLVGYTINRVTMFALILSLGLLVDDPITDVENIARYFKMRVMGERASVLRAIQEVRPALILSTLAIIASFLPLAFITGMMGPYMAPMALNVPLTVGLSTVIAFLVTPWLAMVTLRHEAPVEGEAAFDPTRQPMYRLTSRLLRPVLHSAVLRVAVVLGVVVVLAGAMVLPALRKVPLKMLPYDNKNEFQIVIDMPESTTLEQTDAVARRVGEFLATVAEVRDYQTFAGLSSPMDFNGMVRHYFLRDRPHQADLRVVLAPKERRQQQSHALVLRLRDEVQEIGRDLGARIKLVEVPPGPPVLSTIVAELYAPRDASYEALIEAGRVVHERMAREPLIVDVDHSFEDEQTLWEFETDRPKAALSGVSAADVAETLRIALSGLQATVLHSPHEVDPLWIELRLPRAHRSAIDDLESLYVRGEGGALVQLGGIGRFTARPNDPTIYHKNLRRVVYVTGEVAGRSPADAIVDMQTDEIAPEDTRNAASAEAVIPPVAERTWLQPGGGLPWSLPAGFNVEWAGEGEWKITLDVFRDLGIAFAAALAAIFVILMFQTRSRVLPLVLMTAIPLSMIGIMPGFWLLNAIGERSVAGYPDPIFFTATAMIGMIALAGIVVRNSVVLVDFIHMAQAEGLALGEAIIRSVAVRTRPILLTAGTTLLGNWVITLDPVFSGLAWAIIFGILTSTLFTLVVIPVVYWMIYSKAETAATDLG